MDDTPKLVYKYGLYVEKTFVNGDKRFYEYKSQALDDRPYERGRFDTVEEAYNCFKKIYGDKDDLKVLYYFKFPFFILNDSKYEIEIPSWFCPKDNNKNVRFICEEHMEMTKDNIKCSHTVFYLYKYHNEKVFYDCTVLYNLEKCNYFLLIKNGVITKIDLDLNSLRNYYKLRRIDFIKILQKHLDCIIKDEYDLSLYYPRDPLYDVRDNDVWKFKNARYSYHEKIKEDENRKDDELLASREIKDFI